MKLRIFLPATERPDSAERLAWKLFDARGELRREGLDAPEAMPRVKEVELVLPVERVLFARLKLPKVSAATIRELLPYAVLRPATAWMWEGSASRRSSTA